MSLWAIADTHLSFGVDKPMDIFGDHWQDHTGQLEAAWSKVVQPEDTVLIPGDISWGMNLDEALPDLAFLDRLPGTVILGRGNHDYWWATLRKMSAFVEAHGLHTLRFMRNDAMAFPIEAGVAVVTGTRGWIGPGASEFGAQDKKIYTRELQRMSLSLESARVLTSTPDLLVAALHYPPVQSDGRPTPMGTLLTEAGVDICLYGHVHGIGWRTAYEGTLDGVRYRNVAADRVRFCPILVAP